MAKKPIRPGPKSERKKVKQPFMSGDEFIKKAVALGKTIREMSILLRVKPRTGFRYAADHSQIPSTTADIVRLLAAGIITVKDIGASRK